MLIQTRAVTAVSWRLFVTKEGVDKSQLTGWIARTSPAADLLPIDAWQRDRTLPERLTFTAENPRSLEKSLLSARAGCRIEPTPEVFDRFILGPAFATAFIRILVFQRALVW